MERRSWENRLLGFVLRFFRLISSGGGQLSYKIGQRSSVAEQRFRKPHAKKTAAARKLSPICGGIRVARFVQRIFRVVNPKGRG